MELPWVTFLSPLDICQIPPYDTTSGFCRSNWRKGVIDQWDEQKGEHHVTMEDNAKHWFKLPERTFRILVITRLAYVYVGTCVCADICMCVCVCVCVHHP